MDTRALSRAEAQRIHALQGRKSREREGLFLAEGVRVVEELLDSALALREVVVAPSLEDTARGRALLARAGDRAPVLRTTDAELRRLGGTDAPQGVLAVAGMPARTLRDVGLAQRSVVLVLDGVQDPGNAGTLIRAADAFAVAGVLALPGTVDCWNPKVVRAAAGSLFRMPVVYAAAEDVRAWLAANDVRTYAADAGGRDLDTVVPAARAALVVGNEGAGLSADARTFASEIVAIRMPGHAESLNVAMAAGILLYAFTRRSS